MPIRSPSPGPGYSDPVSGFYSKDRRGDDRKRERDRREREATDYRKRRDLIPDHDNYRIREPSPPRREYYPGRSHSDYPSGPASYHPRSHFPPSNRPSSHSRHSEYSLPRRSVSPNSHGVTSSSGPSHWSSSASSIERHSSRYYNEESDRRSDRSRSSFDSSMNGGPTFTGLPPTGPRHSKHGWDSRDRPPYPRRDRWGSVSSNSRYEHPEYSHSSRGRYNSADEGRFLHRSEPRPEYRDMPHTRPRTPPGRPGRSSLEHKREDSHKLSKSAADADNKTVELDTESHNTVPTKDKRQPPLPEKVATAESDDDHSVANSDKINSNITAMSITESSSVKDENEPTFSEPADTTDESKTPKKIEHEQDSRKFSELHAENTIEQIENEFPKVETIELLQTSSKPADEPPIEMSTQNQTDEHSTNGTVVIEQSKKSKSFDQSLDAPVKDVISDESSANASFENESQTDQTTGEENAEAMEQDTMIETTGEPDMKFEISSRTGANGHAALTNAIFPLDRMETEFYELSATSPEKRRKQLKYLDLKNPVRSLYQYEFFERNLNFLKNHGSFLHSSMLNDEENNYSDEQDTRLKYFKLRALWLKECEKLEKEEEDLNDSINEKEPAGREETEQGSTVNGGAQGSPIVSSRRKTGYQRDAVSSEAEFLQILAQLQKEDENDPLQRASLTSARIPDMLFDPISRDEVMFLDTNEHITEKSAPFKRLMIDSIDTFSEEEHELFKEAYVSYPKQFGKISKIMGGLRTFNECVIHYYQTKKQVNYKALVAAKNKRPSGRKVSNASAKKKKREKVTTPGGSTVLTENEDTAYTEAESEVDQAQVDQDPFDALATAAAAQPKVSNEYVDTESKRSATPTPTEDRADVKKMKLAHQSAVSEENVKSSPAESVSVEARTKSSNGDFVSDEFRVSSTGYHFGTATMPKTENVSESEGNWPGKGNGFPQKDKVSSYWSLHEISTFEKLLETYGTDWEDISRFMPNKSVIMLRNYFAKHSTQRGYDVLVSKADKSGSHSPQPVTNGVSPAFPKGPSIGYFAPRGKPTLPAAIDMKSKPPQPFTESPKTVSVLSSLGSVDNPPRPNIKPSKRSSLSNILNPIQEDGKSNDKKYPVTILPPLEDISDTTELRPRGFLTGPLRPTFAPSSIFKFPSAMDQFSSCGYDQHPSSRESNERGSRQK